MNVTAEMISRAISDKPVQPLFNAIAQQSLRAGVPIIVTNTNNNLRVTAKASVGSVPAGTEITDAMFNGSKSGVDVEGFTLNDNTYFTLIDIDTNISLIPNEMRSDAAGMNEQSYMEVLIAIGNKMSEQIMVNFFASLQANIKVLVPAANITEGMAGKIAWDTTVLTPAVGKTAISSLLDDLQLGLPMTMQPGGAAGDIVTVWVSAQDFSVMKNSTVSAFQYNKNGGITSNEFVYVKEESTIDETRNLFRYGFLRRNNLIIRPWNGFLPDTIVLTYQEGTKGERVFYDKVPADLKNNLYMVIKGAFTYDPELTVPLQEVGKSAFNLPWIVDKQLTINKVENAVAQFKVLGKYSSGIYLRESNKLFGYFPNPAA